MTKHFLCLLLVGLTSFQTVHAQKLRGAIVDANGKPIPNSTVYFYETTSGVAADEMGQFELSLPAGTYTCEFRSLGYESKKESITMGKEDKSIRVVLRERSLLLQEVIVTSRKEDPAYRVMRKAIGYAPHYRHQVKEYTSTAYLKGSMTIDKIPALMKRMIKSADKKMGESLNNLVGRPLVMESQNEIHFTSPEKYHQKVMALKTSIPKELDVFKGMSVMASSIYDPTMDGIISPLNSGAFRYYRFKLEDVAYQSDKIINKIRVIPRRASSQLFSGYIYIIENTWNVYAVSLVNSEMGTTTNYRINYQEVKPTVYLPVTYDISAKINTFGVKGAGRYYASLKYLSVKADALKAGVVSVTDFVEEKEVAPKAKAMSPKQQKVLKELEALSQKEELSNKEAYKMAKLMNKASEPEEARQKRESLEIKTEEVVKKEVDSLALEKDSAYWVEARVVPLQIEEQRSYHINDSISVKDTTQRKERKDAVVLSVGDDNGGFMMGKKWKLNDKLSLSVGGLTFLWKEYNYVDGFWLGNLFTIHYKFNKQTALSVTPTVYYATARKSVLWHVNSNVSYSPMRLGRFSISGGHVSRDVNKNLGVSRLLNSGTSLLLAQSHIHFYDSKFLHINNGVDVANGLRLTTDVEIDNRSSLDNRTTYNFRKKKDIPQNIPNSLSGDYPAHTATTVSLGLSYTPFYRYRIVEGKKEYVESRYPTFSFQYQKALPLFGELAPRYNRVAFGIEQNINFSVFDRFRYSLTAGAFFNQKNMYENDYKYFATNSMILTEKYFGNSFNLLTPYTSTNKYWFEGHLSYRSSYLFVKNLPFLQKYIFDEEVHLNSLLLDKKRFYLEPGYSVGLYNIMRVGVFTGFNGKKFDRVGVRVSYPIFQFFEKPLK